MKYIVSQNVNNEVSIFTTEVEDIAKDVIKNIKTQVANEVRQGLPWKVFKDTTNSFMAKISNENDYQYVAAEYEVVK